MPRRTLADMAEITLRTDLNELATLAAFVEQFAADAALPPAVAFQLNLVLDELVTNAIEYGHPAGGGSDAGAGIYLRLERLGDLLEVHLVDGGIAFDPRTRADPDLTAPIEERQIGGLGIHLVRHYVDDVDYTREGGRNHVRLRKRLTARRDDSAPR
ncbi:MAG: ATP-binding protein [Deltaproteobacteria bacterium]|nr:ATP-binding protein [Deltaproteobacteria bacterium]